MKKVIVSGNRSYGLAKSLQAVFPEAVFASRSTGYDFRDESDRERFVRESLRHDVYISCSSLSDFLQVILLREVYEAWRRERKGGHLIAVGSTVDLQEKAQERFYTVEKKALKDYCLSISLGARGNIQPGVASDVIKVSHLSPGYLDTPSIVRKFPELKTISCDYFAGLIKWVLEQPADINFHQLNLTSIQPD